MEKPTILGGLANPHFTVDIGEFPSNTFFVSPALKIFDNDSIFKNRSDFTRTNNEMINNFEVDELYDFNILDQSYLNSTNSNSSISSISSVDTDAASIETQASLQINYSIPTQVQTNNFKHQVFPRISHQHLVDLVVSFLQEFQTALKTASFQKLINDKLQVLDVKVLKYYNELLDNFKDRYQQLSVNHLLTPDTPTVNYYSKNLTALYHFMNTILSNSENLVFLDFCLNQRLN